jgi:hypothetical protein
MSEQTESDIEVSPEASYVINEDVVAEPVVEAEPIIADSVTPEDTALETQDEPIPAAAQKLIAEKAFSEREAKRRADSLQQQLDAMQKPAEVVPETLVIPDRWDFDNDTEYQKSIQQYAQKVAEQGAYANQQTMAKVQQDQAYYAQQQEAAKKQQEVVTAYASRAKDLGVTAESLQEAGVRVARYGIRDDIANAVLSDPEGALITTYLASNPQAIDALNNSTWMTGADTFAQIKAKAGSLKPKTSKAPPPADISSGGAPSPEDNPWGATFE